ncbi:NmrA/HSCARG family protein [Agrobacterium pusense]|uniref:NmrA/HSCARG family protein n=1 Tax=Agrobacterium pusense TaxID=648995 RepID=UPI000880614F|nr:NmrA/HSCARG family protein [Agrobacterium pusense]OOO22972.1 NmrA family protein [Agrobacterium pusense]WKD48057.1 NmrA/HSCARG family protein [Agrobacterium pusense]SDF59001.1 Uncharacterized conserved protein YbjT, contains NAD(P)-binding and DUF2867 domains [Agrobacterium pusense]
MEINPEYLIFGATGQQGGAVARGLNARGKKVRAFVRDPESEKAKRLAAEGISLIKGDLFDPVSIDQAMAGVSGVFSVQASSPSGEVTDAQEIEQGKAIADSAARAGVRHLVYSSSGASGKGRTGMGHFDSKSKIETHIKSLSIPYTITRPATFMEMMMLPGLGLSHDTFTFFMHPEQSMQIIALQDLGRINATILLAPNSYINQAIELSGASVTGSDIQRVFSRAAGRTIRYQRFSDALLAENGFLRDLTRLVDDGTVAGRADIPALEKEFGPMTSMEEWLDGPGKTLFRAALSQVAEEVALR